MPRHDGNTRATTRRKHAGHRMHRKTRLTRIVAGKGRGRKATAWGRGAA